jgi:hypothetical protein
MTNAIRRKVSIDPVLAEVRDLQTKFDLGTSLGAIFEEPMETGLLVNELKLYSRRLNIPGRAEAAGRESERQRELYELRNELDQTYDENEIASIRKQMQQLKDQGSYLDAFYQEQAELGNLETPEALNEQYADLGLTFDRPMSKDEAQLRADIKREQIVRNAVISLGPQGAGVTALQIGTGLTKAIIDPIGIASAFVPVVGQARAARLVQKYGKVRGRAIQGAVEGGAGAVMLEPLMYGLSANQQLDYTYADSLLNVGAGVFLGAGIGSIAGRLSRTVPEKVETVKIDTDIKPDEFGDTVEQPEVEVTNRIGPDEFVGPNNKLKMTLKKFAEIALSAVAAGKNIDLSFLGPVLLDRPQTLTEFVRELGGVKDVPYIGKIATNLERRTSLTGLQIKNQESQYSMEQMVEMAFNEGFIETKSVKALAAALKKDSQGKHIFRKSDQAKAKYYLETSGFDNFDEAFAAEMSLIKADAQNMGFKITDEQVYEIAELRSKGVELDRAYERLGFKTKDARAKLTAEYANNPKNNSDATPEDYDEQPLGETDEVVMLRESVEEQEEYVKNTLPRDRDKMTAEEREAVDEIEANDKNAESQKVAVRNLATCILNEE